MGMGKGAEKPTENGHNKTDHHNNCTSNGHKLELCIQPPPIHENGNATINPQKDEFSIRPLEISDHQKGFVDLLRQLSPSRPLSDDEFQERFAELAEMGDHQYISVIEDPTSHKIIATGSIFIERKFIRGCSKVGHIEDIVVDKVARGARLGQRVVSHLVERARSAGCYKVVLYCKPEVKEFYEKCGFVEKNVQMAFYF
ncbi:hypothetical protein LUZ60_009886 [Juncus effusus]|nr:hypothetical protein LUZ60_009886 [Juncus effusus]